MKFKFVRLVVSLTCMLSTVSVVGCGLGSSDKADRTSEGLATAPTLYSITPSAAGAGSADTAITLIGADFDPTSQAEFAGVGIATTFVDSGHLQATIPASALTVPGDYLVDVDTPGFAISARAHFTVVPTVTIVDPSSIPLSTIDTQITITGLGFDPSSSAVIDSQGLSTLYQSSTQLFATIPASYLSHAQTLPIGVYNPTTGFSVSVVNVTVVGPPPTCDLSSFSPGLTTLAMGIRPTRLVIDACNVYWTEQANGGVQRVAKSGGTAVAFASSTPPPGQTMLSEGLAIDANNVYWSEFVESSGDATGGVALDTGDVVQTNIATGVSTQIWSGTDGPNSVAVDNANVYVLQRNSVERVPIGGGATMLLAQTLDASSLTVTGSSVFWTGYNGQDVVLTVPITGGAATPFATGSLPAATATVVAQDGTNIYWGETTAGATQGVVFSKPLVGGTQATLISGLPIEPLGIAFDASYLYVATGKAGTILKVAKTGGAVTTLASGQGWPYGIAVDANFVYWANNNGGPSSIMRIAK